MAEIEMQEPDATWGSEAETLWREVLQEWQLTPDGFAILRAGCDSLNRYHSAARMLQSEGLTIRAGDLVRKHPCTEIAKNSLAGFLSSMRALHLEQDGGNPGPGNPGSYKLWLKRGKA